MVEREVTTVIPLVYCKRIFIAYHTRHCVHPLFHSVTSEIGAVTAQPVSDLLGHY